MWQAYPKRQAYGYGNFDNFRLRNLDSGCLTCSYRIDLFQIVLKPHMAWHLIAGNAMLLCLPDRIHKIQNLTESQY
jgi:hypothetical protein